MIPSLLFASILAASAPATAPEPSLSEAAHTYGACMILAAGKFDDGVTDIHIVQRAAAPQCDSLVDPYWQAALRDEPRLAGHEVEWKSKATEDEGIRAILYRRAGKKK